MAITQASGFPYYNPGAPSSTIPSVVLGAQGDLVIVDILIDQTGVTVAGVSAPYIVFGTNKVFTNQEGFDMEEWTAVVTGAGAGQTVTITVTYSTTVTNFVNLIVDEISSGLGSNTLWTPQTYVTYSNASAATCSWASVTAPAAGSLIAYHGWGTFAGEFDAGNSPVNGAAFVYDWVYGDGLAFSGAIVNSQAYQPTGTLYAPATSDSIATAWSATLPAPSGSPIVTSLAFHRSSFA